VFDSFSSSPTSQRRAAARREARAAVDQVWVLPDDTDLAQVLPMCPDQPWPLEEEAVVLVCDGRGAKRGSGGLDMME
jgi:hypothetical protein